jgi:hypothetical protein
MPKDDLNEFIISASVNGRDQSAGPTVAPSSEDDIFDPDRLRLSQNFTDDLGVRALLTVPVRKPGKQVFFRTQASPEYRLDTAILELKEEREIYLVDRSLLPVLGDEVATVTLFTCIDRSGNLFLTPARIPSSDGRANEWHISYLRCLELAMEDWIRVQADLRLGGYHAFTAAAKLPEPQWPDATFKKILGVAFRDRFIRDLDHLVIRKLRGSV